MDFLKLFQTAGKLKKTKRTGWIKKGIKNAESIADHSFRTAFIAMFVAPYLKVNQSKLIKMALIHDLGEAEVGDIIWERGHLKDHDLRQKKERAEIKAMEEMLKEFDDEYIGLFHELLERKTEEAKILWQIDRLERILQAYEYQKEQGVDLSEFFTHAEEHITHPQLRKLLRQILV